MAICVVEQSDARARVQGIADAKDQKIRAKKILNIAV